EDGIRDFHVTGVQTCALPISLAIASCSSEPPTPAALAPSAPIRVAAAAVDAIARERGTTREEALRLGTEDALLAQQLGRRDPARSEERRAGKEGMTREPPGAL